MKPRLWTLVVVVLSAPLVLTLVMALALILNGLVQGTPLSELTVSAAAPETLGVIMLANGLGFAALGVLPALRSREPLLQRLQLRRGLLGRERGLALLMLGAVLAFCVSTAATNGVLSLVGGELSGTLVKLAELMRDAKGTRLAVLWLAIVVAAPVGEELFFRGYLQTRLVARLGAPAAIVVTSALFALAHFDVVHSFATFFMGLSFGYVAHRARSLYFALFAHFANNALAFAATRQAASELTGSVREYAGWALGYGAFAILLLAAFHRLTRKSVLGPQADFQQALAED